MTERPFHVHTFSAATCSEAFRFFAFFAAAAVAASVTIAEGGAIGGLEAMAGRCDVACPPCCWTLACCCCWSCISADIWAPCWLRPAWGAADLLAAASCCKSCSRCCGVSCMAVKYSAVTGGSQYLPVRAFVFLAGYIWRRDPRYSLPVTRPRAWLFLTLLEDSSR